MLKCHLFFSQFRGSKVVLPPAPGLKAQVGAPNNSARLILHLSAGLGNQLAPTQHKWTELSLAQLWQNSFFFFHIAPIINGEISLKEESFVSLPWKFSFFGCIRGTLCTYVWATFRKWASTRSAEGTHRFFLLKLLWSETKRHRL